MRNYRYRVIQYRVVTSSSTEQSQVGHHVRDMLKIRQYFSRQFSIRSYMHTQLCIKTITHINFPFTIQISPGCKSTLKSHFNLCITESVMTKMSTICAINFAQRTISYCPICEPMYRLYRPVMIDCNFQGSAKRKAVSGRDRDGYEEKGAVRSRAFSAQKTATFIQFP